MSTMHDAVHRTLHGWLPRAMGHGRASMLGMAQRPHEYQRSAAHLARPLYRRVIADVVEAAAELPPGARVLDLGTGPGLLPVSLATACPSLRIDAVDLAPEMIEQARRNAADAGRTAPDSPRAPISFEVADVGQLPYPDASFDLIVSTISQHHWTDPAAGLREAARVLRPGGQAWIYDFRWSLRRAEAAAAPLRPRVTVTRQRRLPASSWFNPIGRLVLRAPAQP